jgi:excisionase family DNA binding protein
VLRHVQHDAIMKYMNVQMLLSTGQAASALGVDSQTVRRWCRAGRIEAYQYGGPHGTWHIPYGEISRLMTRKGR